MHCCIGLFLQLAQWPKRWPENLSSPWTIQLKVSMDKAPFDTIIPTGVRPGCNDSLFLYAGFDPGTYICRFHCRN
jgi:hypothetical protein